MASTIAASASTDGSIRKEPLVAALTSPHNAAETKGQETPADPHRAQTLDGVVSRIDNKTCAAIEKTVVALNGEAEHEVAAHNFHNSSGDINERQAPGTYRWPLCHPRRRFYPSSPRFFVLDSPLSVEDSDTESEKLYSFPDMSDVPEEDPAGLLRLRWAELMEDDVDADEVTGEKAGTDNAVPAGIYDDGDAAWNTHGDNAQTTAVSNAGDKKNIVGNIATATPLQIGGRGEARVKTFYELIWRTRGSGSGRH